MTLERTRAVIAALLLATAAWTETRAEDGFKPLFDGKTSKGWRTLKKPEFPSKGWVIENGTLKCLAKGGGGDIVTDATFSEFHLKWEWNIAKAGNSGVKYFITPERGGIGHEYQLIDDTGHPDANLGDKRKTASFYVVLPPKADKGLKPPGEWNRSEIVVKGQSVTHKLNGKVVLEYTLGSPEVKEGVATSKFKDVKNFGERVPGHILLQDHGDEISFRNIEIKDLSK